MASSSSSSSHPRKHVPCLYSFPFANNNVHDRISSCIEWSPLIKRERNDSNDNLSSNNICIISSNQMYLLDPGCDRRGTHRSCLSFNKTLVEIPDGWKTFVEIPDEWKVSGKDSGETSNRKRRLDESFDEYSQSLRGRLSSKQDEYLAKMDRFMSRLNHPFKDSFLGIRSARWSPCNRFLALLKLDGDVLLFRKSRNNSRMILLPKTCTRIQELIQGNCIKRNSSNPLERIETYQEMKEHLYKSIINCICWSSSSSTTSSSTGSSDGSKESSGKKSGKEETHEGGKSTKNESSDSMLLIAGSKSGFIYFFELTFPSPSSFTRKLDPSDGPAPLVEEDRRKENEEEYHDDVTRINWVKRIHIPSSEQINCLQVIEREKSSASFQGGFMLLSISTLSGQLFLASIMDLIPSLSSSSSGGEGEEVVKTGSEPSSTSIEVEGLSKRGKKVPSTERSDIVRIEDKSVKFLSIWSEKDDLTIDHFLIINDDGNQEPEEGVEKERERNPVREERNPRRGREERNPGRGREERNPRRGRRGKEDEYRLMIIGSKSTSLLFIKLVLKCDSRGVSIMDKKILIGSNGCQMTASGVTETNDPDRVLVSSFDGRIVQVRIPSEESFDQSPDESVVSLQVEQLDIDTAFPTHSIISGLASSPHRTMSCILQRVVIIHDPIRIKETNRFLIFPNVTLDQVMTQLNEYSTQSDASTQNKASTQINAPGSMSQILEYIYCYRGFLDQAALVSSMKEKILSLDPFVDLTLRNLGLKSLKTIRHRALALIQYFKKSLKSTDSKSLDKLDKIVKELELEIFERQGSEFLESIKGRGMNELQTESLIHLSHALNQRPSLPGLVSKQKCLFCHQTIQMSTSVSNETLQSATCVNGHKMSRCSNSFIPIDVTSYETVTCNLCSKSMLSPPVWPHISLCIFCY